MARPNSLLTLFGHLFMATAALGADPGPELLPMPKVAIEVTPLPLPPPALLPPVEMGPLGPVLPGFFLPDPNAHWQFVAPGQQGFFKPRVIMAPQPFYLSNGQPYYFYRVRPSDYLGAPLPR